MHLSPLKGYEGPSMIYHTDGFTIGGKPKLQASTFVTIGPRLLRSIPRPTGCRCLSEGLETYGSKLGASAFYQFLRRRLDILEGVIQMEFFPLVTAHMMKGKHVDALDISKPCGEGGDVADVVNII